MKKKQSNQNLGGFEESWDQSSSEFGSDFSSSSGGSEQFSGTSFDNAPVSPAPAPRQRAGKGTQLAVIFGILGALALGVAFFFLIPRGNMVKTAAPGTGAPAGETAYLAPDCELLLNELLVTTGKDVTLGALEEKLLKLDGAVVGYLPLISQYQVRFNTTTREELDQKKAALSAESIVERADYNYILHLKNDGRASCSVSLPAVAEKSIGLMGCLPAADAEKGECFYLSSHELADAAVAHEVLPMRAADVQSSIRAEQAAGLLSRSGKQYFASVFYFSQNDDGSLGGCTTSFALRYQLCSLVNAGAETIVFPYIAPALLSGSVPEEEASLNAYFLEALEANHPSFVICKAWSENDCVIRALAGTETGRRHLLCAAAMNDTPLRALDAAGTGKTLYYVPENISGADLAAAGNSAETAVFHAAAVLASRRTPEAADPAALKSGLISACGALAGGRDGAVVSAMDSPASGGTAGAYRLLYLSAADSRTGHRVSNVSYTVQTGAGTFRDTAADGSLYVLCPAGLPVITAEAENYSPARAESDEEKVRLEIRMTGTQSVGTIAGRITLRGGGDTGELYATLHDTQTGADTLPLQIGENFSLEAVPGVYDLILSGRNRTSVTVHGLTVTAGQTVRVEKEIMLFVISDMNGEASGLVKNAMTGDVLEGVSLAFHEGINAPQSDTPLATVVTDSRGRYTASLPGGVYTAYVSKDGFRKDQLQVISEGEKNTGEQNITITPTIGAGEIRIVLDWGPNPPDLDAHLVNVSEGIHTFYANKEAIKDGQTVAMLDVDALGSMNPDGSNRTETTTIKKLLSGEYVFYIHDYYYSRKNPCDEMSKSGAKVTVFLGGDEGQKYEFTVPNEPGTLWEVFRMQDGVVRPTNIMTYHESSHSVGQ